MQMHAILSFIADSVFWSSNILFGFICGCSVLVLHSLIFSLFCFFSVCLLNRFKSKYHPEEYAKRQEEIRASLRNRLKVFLELQSAGRFNNVSVDVDKTDEMLKVLDAGWFNDCLLGEIYATVRCIQLLNKRPEENGRCPCYSCNSSSKGSLELCYHITSSAHYTQDVGYTRTSNFSQLMMLTYHYFPFGSCDQDGGRIRHRPYSPRSTCR